MKKTYYLKRLLVSVFLSFITIGLYWQTSKCDFVNFDDPSYVYDCDEVKGGFCISGLKWAFVQPNNANYHPLTYLSHMIDVSLFGVTNPGAMHLHNVLLHSVNVALLFWFLCLVLQKPQTTGERPNNLYRVMIAAAIGVAFWGWHPLRVESVAWISSRKDVLSGLFCLLGLLAWLLHVRGVYHGVDRYSGLSLRKIFLSAPSQPRAKKTSILLGVTLLCFVLGFFSKPTMLVYPGLLALIEWYEAGRIRWRPLLTAALMSMAFLGMTIIAQTEAITTVISIPDRIGNAFISIVVYVRQIILPLHLSVFYPHNTPLAVWDVVMGVVVCIVLLVIMSFSLKRFPSVAVAIAWFLITLVPVIGIIQVGSAAHADRYTYLATLGCSVLLAVYNMKEWSVGASDKRVRVYRVMKVGIQLILVAVYCVVTLKYIDCWKNTETLFTHAAQVTQRNSMAYCTLGAIYAKKLGDRNQAIAIDYWRKALAINRNAETLGNVALWSMLNDSSTAVSAGKLAQEAIMLDKNEKIARAAYGFYCFLQKDWKNAEEHLLAAGGYNFNANPLYWEWLAIACYQQNKFKEARFYIEKALSLDTRNMRYTSMREALRQKLEQPMGPLTNQKP